MSSTTHLIIPNLFAPNPSCVRPIAIKPEPKSAIAAIASASHAMIDSGRNKAGSGFRGRKVEVEKATGCGIFSLCRIQPNAKKVAEAAKTADTVAKTVVRKDKPLHKVTTGLSAGHDELQRRRYSIGAKLGAGGFSEVFRAIETHSERAYAIKVINSKYQDAGIGEFHQLRDLQSMPHIVKMHNCYSEKGSICLVLELLSGSLLGKKTLSIHDLSKLTKQLVETLLSLQEKDILHGDLKPHNLNFSNETLTIFDWNLVATPEERREGKLIQTKYYRAPEVFLQKPYGFNVISWNIGVILYHLYVGQALFNCNKKNELETFFTSIFPYLGPIPKAWMQGVPLVIKGWFTRNVKGDYLPFSIGIFDKNNPGDFTPIESTIAGVAACKKETSPLVSHLQEFLRKTVRYEKRLSLSEMLEHPFVTAS